ncbi:PREDICTED: complexin-2 [Aptenodytes forsteri]|nr:PREDICTED: complexin-2 [Aptenodytes forsteri]
MDFVMKQALGGATKDMGKMLGGEEEKDPDAQKKEEERQEALRQQEEERKAKHARMEAEREKVRQQIRDKYGLKKKEEKEAEEKAALEQPCEGSLTRPKKAIPAGCGDEEEEEEESILDTVLKYLPGPLQDMFKKYQPPTLPWGAGAWAPSSLRPLHQFPWPPGGGAVPAPPPHPIMPFPPTRPKTHPVPSRQGPPNHAVPKGSSPGRTGRTGTKCTDPPAAHQGPPREVAGSLGPCRHAVTILLELVFDKLIK